MARNLSDLRRMQRNQLARINKEELIDTILAAQDDELPALSSLEEKLNAVMAEVAEVKAAITSPDSFVTRKFVELQEKIDKQAEIIANQQRFLEMLDRKERETNVVVLGLPDEGEALDGARTDAEKLERVWNKMDVAGVECQHRRLGAEADGRRKRPLLLTIRDKDTRSRILANAKKLKEAGENYTRIFVKKDVHPGVRREWKRLREAEDREKQRPENVGCVIRLDTRQRKLYRDDVVIDGWNPQFL